jgi:hypothetical protein
MKGKMLAAPLLGALCCAPLASGAEISYNNQMLTDSDAPRARLLRIQNGTSEWGFALRDADSHTDYFGGNTHPQSHTVRVGTLLNRGITADNFAVLLTVKEPDVRPTIKLSNFTLVFYNAHDDVQFEASFTQDSPLVLRPVTPNSGINGHVFQIGLTESRKSQLFDHGNWRVGIIVPEDSPILKSHGGWEQFFITASSPLPSPGSLALLGVALAISVRDRRRGPVPALLAA